MTGRLKVRPSQFVLSYGPGALLEGPDGPRLIRDAGIGLFPEHGGRDPNRYRIDDDRMSRGLLNGAKIYRLPTESETGDGAPYGTMEFPVWKLCLSRHGKGGDYLLHRRQTCPDCGRDRGQGAIRFVVACSAGHLDELNWDHFVHGKSGHAVDTSRLRIREGEAFYWHRSGGALGDIVVKCYYHDQCHAQTRLGDLYRQPHICSGRHPHREFAEPVRPRNCASNARVVPRQSAILRVADTRTLLSIRPVTEVHTLLQDDALRAAIAQERARGQIDHEGFKRIVMIQEDAGSISAGTRDKLLGAGWEVVRDALEYATKRGPTTYDGLIKDEFAGLLSASVDGAPPSRDEAAGREYGGVKMVLEIKADHSESIEAGGSRIRVTPVQKLRTVTVQKGFTRGIGGWESRPEPVDVSFSRGGKRWYPGVEYIGEGLFMRLEDGDGWAEAPTGDAAGAWLEALEGHDRDRYPPYAFRDDGLREEMHPGFVWWHTLAHLLVRTIGEQSGYSAAAIRERVYFERGGGDGDGRFRGGLLLYATQPGNEGAMGGLVGMMPHMGEMLGASLERGRACSGDPLCGESALRDGGYNGASCYACLLNSETSCEHRNMWLDRSVLNQGLRACRA